MKFKNYIEVQSGIKDSADSPGTSSQVLTSTATGVAWIDQAEIISGTAEKVSILVKNAEGAALVKGDPVYIIGSVGASARLEVGLCDASDPDKMPCVGLLEQDLLNNGEGNAVTAGKLRNLVTTPIDGQATSENDTIYVKAGGSSGSSLTTTKPTGSTNLIQNVGQVGRVSSSSDGNFVVSAIMRTNDVPNLPEGRIWVGDGNTIVSDTVYIDEPNNRVGIGTTSPNAKLEVLGVNNDVILKLIRGNNTAQYLDFRGYQVASNGNHLVLSADDAKQVWIGHQTAQSQLVVDTDGNVGIGTDSPQSKLHIETGSGGTYNPNASHDDVTIEGSGNIGLQLFSPATSYQYIAFGDPGSVNVGYLRYYHGTNQMVFRTNGSDNMVIDTSGNVGIGTTSPGSKLDVAGGDIRLSTNSTYLRSKDSASGTPRVLGMNASNAFYIGPIDSYAGGGIIYGASSNVSYHGFYGGGSEKVRITSAGNVGIGTTSPVAKLSVKSSGTNNWVFRATASDGGDLGGIYEDGGTNAELYIKNSAGTSSVLINSSGDSYFNGGSVGIGTTSPRGKLDITNGSTGQTYSNISGLLIDVNGSSNSYYGLRVGSSTGNSNLAVTNAGNVGIGTDSPSAKLDVAGTVKYNTQLSTNDLMGQKAFIGISSGTGAQKFKIYKNTSTADGYARFKIDRAFDYGNNDQMVQEAIYQRRNTIKNFVFRYDGDTSTSDDVYLEVYELSNGQVEIWLCVDDYAQPVVEVISNPGTSEIFTSPSAGTPTGTLIRSSNPDTETPNWNSHQGAVNISDSLTFTGSGTGSLTAGNGLEEISLNVVDSNDGNNPDNFLISLDNAGSGGFYAKTLELGDIEGVENETKITIDSTDSKIILENANVGIGASSPSQRLEVSGNIQATGTRSISSLFDANHYMRLEANSSGGILKGTDGGVVTTLVRTYGDSYFNGGNIGIGTTSPGAPLHVEGPISGNGLIADFSINGGSGFGMNNLRVEIPQYGSGIKVYSPTSSSTDNSAMTFYQQTSNVGNITINTSSTSFNTTSDYRLKENKEDISDAIERVKELKPLRFNWIKEPGKPKVDGFYAHELAEVVPEAVTGEKDALDWEGNPEYQAIDQSKIVPLLTAALQQAIDKIEQLETKIQTIENNK